MTAVGFNGQGGAAQGPAHAALIGEGEGLEGGSRGILSKTEELGNQQLQRQTTGAQAGAGKAHDSRHDVPLAKVIIRSCKTQKLRVLITVARQQAYSPCGYFITPTPGVEFSDRPFSSTAIVKTSWMSGTKKPRLGDGRGTVWRWCD